jgi:hypothetical protein
MAEDAHVLFRVSLLGSDVKLAIAVQARPNIFNGCHPPARKRSFNADTRVIVSHLSHT